MRRSLATVLGLIATLMLVTTAVAAPVGTTTINLRTWEGTRAIDDVRVCLARGGQQIVCGETEDGELWADSLPAGACPPTRCVARSRRRYSRWSRARW